VICRGDVYKSDKQDKANEEFQSRQTHNLTKTIIILDSIIKFDQNIQ
jgi:hypothetical protein